MRLTRASTVATLVCALGCEAGAGGLPPRIEAMPDEIAVVGQAQDIWILGSDPEGDALRYTFESALPLQESTTQIATSANGHGLFTITPLVDQIGEQFIDFIVSDGAAEDRYTIRLEIRSAAGSDATPVFRRPVASGAVVDLAETTCVELEIEVDDSDSSEITLAMAEPILEGSELTTATDGRTAHWRWCPEPQQLQATSEHELVLLADDGESIPVEKRFVIVVRNDEGGECGGSQPVLVHDPRDATTVADLELEAQMLGSDSSAAPVLLYATSDPGTPPEYGSMSAAPMQSTGGDTWSVVVPNPVTDEGPGAQALLYYVVSAVGAEGCVVDHPATGVHVMTVTNPGGEGGAPCAPCSGDAQCGGSSDLCLAQPGGSACASVCEEPGDCPAGFACSPEPLVSVQGAAQRQCVPVAGACVDASPCVGDPFEPNDAVAEALAKPPLASGETPGLTLCPGDDDWFFVSLSSRTKVVAELIGSPQTDLDLVLTSDGGVIVAASEGATSEELLTSSCLNPGSYLLRVYSIFETSAASADYTLNLATDPAGC